MQEWGSSARNPHSKHEYHDPSPGEASASPQIQLDIMRPLWRLRPGEGQCDGTCHEGNAKDRVSQQSKKVDGLHAKHPNVPAGRAEKL